MARLRVGWAGLILALALAIYLAATLPHLGDFPLIDQDEAWIAAPAAKFAFQGVYGNDLFTGYYGQERRTVNFPPIFLLAESLAFRLFGVGVVQARAVAVAFGAATLLLTYWLGRLLYDRMVGALAVAFLVGLHLTVERFGSGIPLLDLARIARYDIAVPPLMLATLCCFVVAETRDPQLPPLRWQYFATGALGGLAFLAHVYGGAALAVIGVLLLWRHGLRIFRRPEPYLIVVGFVVTILPWALFIAQDFANYRGQMLPEQTRFRFWELGFYLDSLQREPDRYWRFLYLNQKPVLWPRLGIWVVFIGLPVSIIILLVRAFRKTGTPADRLLLLAGPLTAFLLGALINLKFYNYMVIVLPFGALNLALVAVLAWRAVARIQRPVRLVLRGAMVLLLAVALLEGGLGIRQGLDQAAAISNYQAFTSQIAAVIPPRARVLALHQFWFGVYSQQYEYRSIVLAYYLSEAATNPPVALSMDRALERIAPQYILIDRYMAPDLHLDQPANALTNPQQRLFRNYMERHRAKSITQITDPSYGSVLVYKLQR